MAKTRGFRLGHKLVRVFKWCIHRRRRRRPTTYRRLRSAAGAPAAVTKLVNKWVRSLRRLVCSCRSNSGYIPVGKEPLELPASVPKGHLAVYVGDGEDDTCRVLVPVVFFNHPLFGELLREAEKVYGFDHPGGIQIPCPKSELESVQMKIAAAGGGRRWRRRWS